MGPHWPTTLEEVTHSWHRAFCLIVYYLLGALLPYYMAPPLKLFQESSIVEGFHVTLKFVVSVSYPSCTLYFLLYLVSHSLPHVNLLVPLFPFNILHYCVLSHFPRKPLRLAFLLIFWLLSMFQIEYTAKLRVFSLQVREN